MSGHWLGNFIRVNAAVIGVILRKIIAFRVLYHGESGPDRHPDDIIGQRHFFHSCDP